MFWRFLDTRSSLEKVKKKLLAFMWKISIFNTNDTSTKHLQNTDDTRIVHVRPSKETSMSSYSSCTFHGQCAHVPRGVLVFIAHWSLTHTINTSCAAFLAITLPAVDLNNEVCSIILYYYFVSLSPTLWQAGTKGKTPYRKHESQEVSRRFRMAWSWSTGCYGAVRESQPHLIVGVSW